MKRIGIVSRVHGLNYGANLQALALLDVLKRIPEVQAEYINFKVSGSDKGLHRLLSIVYGYVRLLLGAQTRINKTKSFRSKYLAFSDEIKDPQDIIKLCKYDILLSGSDQIWNPRYYKESKGLYLLDFPYTAPRYSYASSFGVSSIDNGYKSICASSLKKYEMVSVREEQALLILNTLGVKNARLDLDPTFLLTSQQWQTYFDTQPLVGGKYILCYVMNGANILNNYIIKQANEFQKKLSEPHKIIILGEKEYKGLLSKNTYISTAGPSEFLNLMYNASYVLTSSYHGTCFSIIFRKNFMTILEKNNQFNSRMESVLKLFKLSHSLYYSDNPSFDVLLTCYDDTELVLDRMRKSSLLYLKSIVESNN